MNIDLPGYFIPIVGGALGIIFQLYRFIEPRLRGRSKSAKLKSDLEILNLLRSSLGSSGPYYATVKGHVDIALKNVYSLPHQQAGRKTEKAKFIALLVVGILFMLGSVYWSILVLKGGWSWWVIGTAYLFFIGVTSIRLGYRIISRHASAIIYVKNSQGKPIRGVFVTPRFQPEAQEVPGGTTEDDGSIAFTYLKPGSYAFQASKSGYTTSKEEVKLQPREANKIDISLET